MRHRDHVLGLYALAAAACLMSPGCQCGPGDALFDAGYGTLWISSGASGQLTVLDAADGGWIGQVALPGDGGRGASVVASPDGEKIYAANEGAGAVSVVDVRAFRVETTFTGLARPRDLRTSPDGRRLYVAQAASNQIAVIDLGSLTVQQVSAGGTSTTSRTQALWVTRAGEVYVLNQLSSALVWMDLAVGAPRWSLPVASNPTSLVIGRAGEVGYLTGAQDGVVQAVRAAGAGAPAAGSTAPVGSSPRWLSLGEDERWLVVSNGGVDNTISVLDLSAGLVEEGKVVVGSGDVGQNAQSPGGGAAFVCVGIPPQLAVVDLARQAVVATYPLPEAPYGLAFLPPLPAGPR